MANAIEAKVIVGFCYFIICKCNVHYYVLFSYDVMLFCKCSYGMERLIKMMKNNWIYRGVVEVELPKCSFRNRSFLREVYKGHWI